MSDDFEQIIRHFAKSLAMFDGPMAFREQNTDTVVSPFTNTIVVLMIQHLIRNCFDDVNCTQNNKEQQFTCWFMVCRS